MDGDFVELQRWNEEVRVGADGSVVWKQGNFSQRGQITPAEANSLLERFRTPAIWRLCGRYDSREECQRVWRCRTGDLQRRGIG